MKKCLIIFSVSRLLFLCNEITLFTPDIVWSTEVGAENVNTLDDTDEFSVSVWNCFVGLNWTTGLNWNFLSSHGILDKTEPFCRVLVTVVDRGAGNLKLLPDMVDVFDSDAKNVIFFFVK